jgi:hypothetical protein
MNVPPLNLPRQTPIMSEDNEDLDAVMNYLQRILDEFQLWVNKLRTLNP